MPSKQVTERQRAALAVQEAARSHAPELAAALGERLGGLLRPGEHLPDCGQFAELLGRLLERAADRMVQTDDTHLAELLDDAPARRDRIEATEALSAELESIRGTLRHLYPPGTELQLGLSGATATDSLTLLGQAEGAVVRLRDPSFQLPLSKVLGVSVDPLSWAERLQGPIDALRASIDKVRLEAMEAEETFGSKMEARVAFDQAYAGVRDTLLALARLAGCSALAARLRSEELR